jgi:hypothetical protein
MLGRRSPQRIDGRIPREEATPSPRPSLVKGAAPALGAAGALVAVSTAVSALVFSLWPGLKPSPPPQKLSASFTKIEVEPDVSFRAYVNRLARPRPALDAAEKAVRRAIRSPGAPRVTNRQILHAVMTANGLEVYVQVQVEGFRVRQFRPVRVSLYDAATGSQLTFRHPRGNVFVPLGTVLAGVMRLGGSSHLRPSAPTDLRGALLWAVSPSRRGRFFVRVELYDVNGDLIDFKDSATFRCVENLVTGVGVRCLVPR